MNPPINQGRRMSDKTVPLDVAQQALHLAGMESDQKLLTAEMRQNMQVLRASNEAMQADMRKLTESVSALATLQHAHDANGRAIEEVKAQVGGINDKLERWFDQIESESRQRWERHDKERDQYREKHEADNQKTKDKLTLWTGIGITVMFIGGVIITGFLYVLNDKFLDVTTSQQRVERQQEASRTEAAADREKINDIRIYIAEQKGKQQ
jgi:hypothetical protein